MLHSQVPRQRVVLGAGTCNCVRESNRESQGAGAVMDMKAKKNR